jgi:predicted ester cyclase
MQMFRVIDRRIVESWAVRDDLGVLRQLGHTGGTAPHDQR